MVIWSRQPDHRHNCRRSFPFPCCLVYIAVVVFSFIFSLKHFVLDVRSSVWILQLKTSKILYILQDHAFTVARRCAFTARACGPSDDAACLSSTMPPCSCCPPDDAICVDPPMMLSTTLPRPRPICGVSMKSDISYMGRCGPRRDD